MISLVATQAVSLVVNRLLTLYDLGVRSREPHRSRARQSPVPVIGCCGGEPQEDRVVTSGSLGYWVTAIWAII